MKNAINIKTGNPIVDEIATLNITGNIIPETWYHTIVNDKGKVNCLAIHILADIVYWYRPTENRDETTLAVSYTKKFHDEDYLQRSYEQLMNKFNISRRQAYDALILLENLGVVKRVFKDIVVAGTPLSNVMFLELIPSVLKELTYPNNTSEEGLYKNVNTPFPECKEASSKLKTPLCENAKTYTNTTTENTTNTSSTSLGDEKQSPVVDEAKEVFSGLGLSEQDVASIVRASGNDIGICKTALMVLNQQTKKVVNVAGWLIKAVANNYQPISKSPAMKKNSFNNFHQREYDFDELEKVLLARPVG